MKTNVTFKHILLALAMMVSIAACKKDKKEDPTPPPVEVKAMAFAELKALSTGASVKVPDAKKITGIVISDASAKNIDSKTVVLQETTGQTGLIVTFDAAQTFAVGDQLEVIVSNQTLAQTNGEIVLQNVPAANVKKTGTGTITAKATTVAEIATNRAAWDGTLVTIAATDISGTTAKYSGTLTITDASGTVTSNVLAGASFVTTDLPLSVTSIIGIVRNNGTDSRVDIRNTTDVATGSITRVITEDFSQMSVESAGIRYGFYSDFTNWSTSGNLTYDEGSAHGNDASFTTTGKKYPYLNGTEYNAVFYNNAGFRITPAWYSGAKTITVTFAGSTENNLTATDYIQMRIEPFFNSSSVPVVPANLLGVSTQYHETGKFFTLKYTVPTQDQLVAAGLNATVASNWLKAPRFYFFNMSKSSNVNSPILIDKVTFGFDK